MALLERNFPRSLAYANDKYLPGHGEYVAVMSSVSRLVLLGTEEGDGIGVVRLFDAVGTRAGDDALLFSYGPAKGAADTGLTVITSNYVGDLLYEGQPPEKVAIQRAGGYLQQTPQRLNNCNALNLPAAADNLGLLLAEHEHRTRKLLQLADSVGGLTGARVFYEDLLHYVPQQEVTVDEEWCGGV